MALSDDRDLATLASIGDRDAFGELVRRHQTAVFNTAYRLLGNRRDAEDAAQESFIRAYGAFASFDTQRPLLPWLRRITTNLCLNRIKGDRPHLSLDEGLSPPRETRPGPEAQAVNRDESQIIRQEILKLPSRYRAAIELRHFAGLSYAEIAQSLGRPLSDVKSDLFRGRKMLAKHLKELIDREG